MQNFLSDDSNLLENIRIEQIEIQLSLIFKHNTVLVPSVRSGMSQILNILGINRDKDVFITKYSSHCLYTSLGAFTNITTTNLAQDVTILNNKWGYTNIQGNLPKTSDILDDSCDTYFSSEYKHFANGELASFISLPKVIGSYTGGIILLNDNNHHFDRLIQGLSENQNKNKELGLWQENQKKLDYMGRSSNDFANWDNYLLINIQFYSQ